MAENAGVWGVEIGQAGLKAIRLRYAEAAEQVIAVAFDYVPHAKILSQPDAIPEELIAHALEQFLSRNNVQGDQVVIAVPGQTALTRFVNLPPVPANKVPEIVKYEARQTIPFALEDVIWDYQVLSQGSEESDFMLDAEVGIFAMKREEVMSRLKYFQAKKVEVDQIQIAPLALYNMVSFDHMGLRPGKEIEAEDEFTIVLDMGADATTLVVTNGAKIWIRNVPIGGNHFTRALTKEMKLTFAKAEHLKCNATKAPDPRAVFQALRPVFNDYVSEIQRSIGYFSSVNRSAKIQKVVGVGNGFKLAGLQKFLHQNLQYDVERLGSYQSLAGDTVQGDPMFQENILTFAVPYGLALQGLGLTRIHTGLLPPEIVTERKIRAKKPWAAAAAAAMLFGVALSGIGYARVEQSVSPERFGTAEQAVAGLKSEVDGYAGEYTQAETRHAEIMTKGQVLLDNLERRAQWLELYKAINEALPRDPGGASENDPAKQERIHLQAITAQHYDDLAPWFQQLAATRKYAVDSLLEEDRKPPVGPGFLVTLSGYHYNEKGHPFENDTLLKNLQQWRSANKVPIRELGITHAAVVQTTTVPKDWQWHPDPRVQALLQQQNRGGGFGGGGFDGPMGPGPGGAGEVGEGDLLNEEVRSQIKELKERKFVLQFVWQPTLASEREVNEMFFQVLAKNKDAAFADAQAVVTEWNEKHLDRKPIEITEEQFTKFKHKYFEKPTADPAAGGVPGGVPPGMEVAPAGP